MSVEIKNYVTQPPGKSHIGTFDLVLIEWGACVYQCRHYRKDGREWIEFPSKYGKNPDDTWAKPIPYFGLQDPERNKKLKEIILQAIAKIPIPLQEHGLPF